MGIEGKRRAPSFAKKDGVPLNAGSGKRERGALKAFTHDTILAHTNGTTPDNNLIHPDVAGLVDRFKELSERRSDGDSRMNGLVFGGIIAEINTRLKRTGK